LNKISLGDLDNADYKRIFRGEGEDEIINKKLWKAYEDYYIWFDGFNKDELITFYNKLINIAVIIRLDVSFAKDAYKLFESINNRGLKLSPTDIIKNFILGHASKIDNITLEKVKTFWSDIITNLDGINTNQFLRQYMCMLLQRKVTMKGLVEDFKHYYVNHIETAEMLSDASLYSDDDELQDDDEEDVDTKEEVLENEIEKEDMQTIKRVSIVHFLKQVRDFSLLYRKIRMREFGEEKINFHLLNLQRILSFPTYIFLLSLLNRDVSQKTKMEVLSIIETFMLRRHICQKRTGELDNIFAQLIKVSDSNIVSEIKSLLMENLPTDEEFESYFPKHIFKGKLIDRARYVLEQIEYYLIKDKGEYKLSSAMDVHLEHVIPQTILTKRAKKEFGDWVEYLGENAVTKHKRYVSVIGNLTLIAGELNIKASNNPFNNKKDNYKESNIKLNDSLANYYRQFKFPQIEERGKELTKIALKIWKF